MINNNYFTQFKSHLNYFAPAGEKSIYWLIVQRRNYFFNIKDCRNMVNNFGGPEGKTLLLENVVSLCKNTTVIGNSREFVP